MTITITHHAV